MSTDQSHYIIQRSNNMFDSWWERRTPEQRTIVVVMCYVLSFVILILDPT